MRFTNTLLVALRALRRNKMRSVLTALGIIIGIGAVITIVSMGNGAKARVEAQVAALGQNIITVYPGSFSSGGMRGGFGSSATLTVEDAEAIAAEIEDIDGVSPEVRDRNQVLANGLNWNTSVNGESPDYPYIKNWPIVQGAMFSDQDVKSLAKVCVIGKTVVDQLFPNEDPIGQTLRIRNLPFRVVGVLDVKGFSLFGSDQDDVVIIPYTSHMRRVSRRANISSILVQGASPEKLDVVKQRIEDLLTQRRRGREPDFTVRTQEEIAQTATETSKTMTLLLGGIAVVSLIVGGIGVMNIMLVSVTERTREIGIRLAIGAHGRDVLTQFLIEAVLLSVLGGVLGILCGVGASEFASAYFGMPTLVSPGSIVAAVGFSTAIGVFFGFYPARKAAQLDPIEALRYE
ncbi:MAG: ABC transporter permease [Verrucomicrobia bacterium]|nr:ABC transporter permease [Verrucomicrobiota bacterium]